MIVAPFGFMRGQATAADPVSAWVASLPTPPVWWATLGDGSGTTVSTVYGAAGTYTNATVAQASIVGAGTSAAFDGVGGNSYARVGTSGPQPTSAVTVVVWIAPDSWGTVSPVLVEREQFGSDGFVLYLDASGHTVNFRVRGSTGTLTTASMTLAPHVIHAVYDGGHTRLYIDGVAAGTPTAASGSLFSSAAGLTLGNYLEFVSADLQYDGRMQHPMVFDYAIDPADIATAPVP